MNYIPYVFLYKKEVISGVYIFRFISLSGTVMDFLPGQYVYLKNPEYLPVESHPFSIASSPLQKEYLEFCIKIYGDWTHHLSQLGRNSIVHISNPQGKFVWTSKIKHAVFLLGGIGIAPIMSMLRFFIQSKRVPMSLTMLYGNRTFESIMYKEELKKISEILPLKIIHIFSHVLGKDVQAGYHGFITQKIISQEIDIHLHPTFFVVGPPVFVDKMRALLAKHDIDISDIKIELIDKLQEKSSLNFTHDTKIVG